MSLLLAYIKPMLPGSPPRRLGRQGISGRHLALAMACLWGLTPMVSAMPRIVEGFVARAPLGFASEITHVMRFEPGGRVHVALVDPNGRLQDRSLERVRLLGELAEDRTVNDVPVLRVGQVVAAEWARPAPEWRSYAAVWRGDACSHYALEVGAPWPEAAFVPFIIVDSDGDGAPDDADDFPNNPNETTDTDGDGVGNNADSDDDGDDIPDDYEIAHGLNPLLDDAAWDFDFDGMSNRDEYLAGTDVGNPNSLLQVERFVVDWPFSVRLIWQTVPGRIYRVLASGTPGGRLIKIGEDLEATEKHTSMQIPIERRTISTFYLIATDPAP